MRTLLGLLLIAIIVYLLYTSGVLDEALQSLNEAAGPTSTISIQVQSPSLDATGTRPADAPAPMPSSTAAPIATATFPPPTIIIPETPPTLAVSTTPTPASSFPLLIEQPADGQTLNSTPALIVGRTQPDALVSVNDTIGFAGGDGRFTLSVDLEEGPNVLEVLASNINGEQVFVILTVLYNPNS